MVFYNSFCDLEVKVAVNYISKINIFSGFAVKTIIMENNNIRIIDLNAFYGLDNLRTVVLRANNITENNTSTFSRFTIETVILEKNQITNIDFYNLNGPTEIVLRNILAPKRIKETTFVGNAVQKLVLSHTK